MKKYFYQSFYFALQFLLPLVVAWQIDKFIECTQNPDAAWRLTQRVVSVIETEVNGADMSIELE